MYIFDPIDALNNYMRLYQHLRTALSANLESRFDISVNNLWVLMVVGQVGKTASHEIADKTGMPVMAVSRTVVVLEKRGLIERSVDHNNRRRKSIWLTAKGQDLLVRMMPTTQLVAKYVFGSLRFDDALTFDYCLRALTDDLIMVERTASWYL